jgi:hypothetical protein
MLPPIEVLLMLADLPLGPVTVVLLYAPPKFTPIELPPYWAAAGAVRSAVAVRTVESERVFRVMDQVLSQIMIAESRGVSRGQRDFRLFDFEPPFRLPLLILETAFFRRKDFSFSL